jgi:tRNA modification GTPase
MLDADSTIYALSTAPGRAAIAVVRISGPACASVCLVFQARSAFPASYTDNTLPLGIQVPMSE